MYRRICRHAAVDFAVVVVLALGVMAGLSGCGHGSIGDEADEFRAAAKIAVQNRIARHQAHARAEPAFRALSGAFVRSGNQGSVCDVRTRRGSGPIHGAMAVSCGDFGMTWPLTVDHGFLRCETGSFEASDAKRVVFTTPQGRDYAVNEAARWVGYGRIASIFRPDAGPRYRSVLAGAGARLCGE